MQDSIMDWFAQNAGLTIGIMMVPMILLFACYIKSYVRIYSPGVEWRHYRKGKLYNTSDGGMVVRIPFLDRVEVGDGPTYYKGSIIDPLEKSLKKEITVQAEIREVWDAWTTLDGVKSFFAPDAKIDLRLGGPYEMYFNPNATLGSRGGENLRILSYLPPEMISFEWNAPPDFRRIRKVKTWIVVQLKSEVQGRTQVTLTHCGWQDGLEWDEVYNYFEKAWTLVLERLQQRFLYGPIDWESIMNE
ncbi:MAG: SRPBCC domain-containing protein [Candidatus Thorarchaeota archaeon]|nr:SRPBCC domain-containing protein [Candidatus Thorarchaeota archaeon]